MIRDWIARLGRGKSDTETDADPVAERGERDEVSTGSTPPSSRGDTAEPETVQASESSRRVEYPPGFDDLPDPGTRQQSLVAPSSVEELPGTVRVNDDWTRTLWIGEYPDLPGDGLFENLYASPETRHTDISIHLNPRETNATLDSLENRIEDLEADYEYLSDKRRAGARGVRKDLTDYQDLYDVLRNTQTRAFDMSMYLTSRGESKDQLDTDAVMSAARRSPASLTPVVPRWSQLDALVSSSPVGVDRMDETLDVRTPMLSGAIGAMFPFVSGTIAASGIEYGTYALNESPIILDRFARDTGYCMMVIGMLGAGKSFSTKLQLVRRAMFDPETMLVMLDPLEGFASVSNALGGERITVGGTRGLNPLEIRETPVEVLESVSDLDPWAEQIAWVLTFFETFFTHVATNPLGDRKQTLRRAIQETYERQGITRDPETHERESPTIHDVIDVLEALLNDPSRFGYATRGEQESVRRDAQSLLKDLRPSFRPGGDLENMAESTDFDLDAPVIYLDLHQEEGARGRHETSLTMQVLFNAVYERAKQTDKRVLFVIDEAHYLMNDVASLGFLETAVRHSRHYNLSMQFITQTGGEFALTPEARTIADLCSMTLIHRVSEEAESLAEWFGLNEREVSWVRTAKAGNEEDGFSEALLGVDGEGWFPMRVRASEQEVSTLG
ncbi:VirB4 family type IV secretion system protein [Halobium palmae]|uniref:VirB4 family type IV secretion system protein n=1 Tax=Halobium palmae TaxID=1776492 RepID=A0ABD5RW30_9EURY